MTHHTVEVLGRRTHYWTAGPAEGHVIVCIHGFRGTHHGLNDIAGFLPEYRLIIPDLPGFGRSEPLATAYHTIDAYGHWLQAFVQTLSLENIILLGHSMGSQVVAQALQRDPTVAKRVIFINPIAEAATNLDQVKLAPVRAGVWLAAHAMPQRLGDTLLRHPWPTTVISRLMVTTHRQPLRRIIHQYHRRYMNQFAHPRQFAQLMSSSLKHGVVPVADKLTMPVLILAGDNDNIAPLSGQQRLTGRLELSQLVTLKGVGHLIHYERPAEAATHIKRFLDAV